MFMTVSAHEIHLTNLEQCQARPQTHNASKHFIPVYNYLAFLYSAWRLIII